MTNAININKLISYNKAWVFFSRFSEINEVSEKEAFIQHLNDIGTRLRAFEVTGGAVYLYRFDISL